MEEDNYKLKASEEEEEEDEDTESPQPVSKPIKINKITIKPPKNQTITQLLVVVQNH